MTLERAQKLRLESLYREQHQKVFMTALKFAAADREWAKDRTQDTFVILARHLDRLEPDEDLSGWLYRVVVNLCLKEIRKQTGWRKVIGILPGSESRTDDRLENRTRARRDLSRLEQTIAELPVLQRALMVLIYFEEKTQSEAGALLGLSKGYTSKLHAKAVAALENMDWEHTDG